MVVYDFLLQINWNVDPEIFRIDGFALRYYSLFFVFAFGLSYWILSNIYRKDNISVDYLGTLSVYVFLGTLVGARLGQVFFYEFEYYRNHPLEIILPFRIDPESGFEFTGFQGLASHGGAIGILIAILLYCRKYKQSFLWVADKVAIVVPLAGFFIRLGNLFNSEIIGKPFFGSWAFVFSKVDFVPRHPAQLYEAISYLIIFFLIYSVYKVKGKVLKVGFLFGLFLVSVFSARFLLEFFKENQEAFESSLLLNMGQILSVPLIVAGLFILYKTSGQKTIPSNPK